VDYLVALRREENEDREEETNERPGRGESEEDLVVELFAANLEECKTCEDGCTKGDAEEDRYTGCYCGIRNADPRPAVADNLYEKECERREEDDLEE
jgi:uncharacterized Fe-S radical SAM superfamily protein PflX